ncbi:MAG TPA: sulfatase, partial [Polyangiales bacterium]|nr:sulfatase [Polyangiales bacterium]
ASPAILVPNAPSHPAHLAKSAVLLSIGSLRPDHLHAYNPNTRVVTPALDAFAAEATVFENAQSTEGSTKPALASLLTGLYPTSHGVKGRDARLADEALLVSEAFKQAGFATAGFVSDAYLSAQFGFDQGWDQYKSYVREDESGDAVALFRDAARWIEARKGERFFLFLQTNETSASSDPSAHVADRDRPHLEALYDAAISDQDRQLGPFIERLKTLGLYDQIALFVTADHGEEFGDHGSYGHGRSIYQELLHVPLVARLPARSAGRIADTVSIVDVAPTLLAAAGAPVPPVMEGVDRLTSAPSTNAPSTNAPLAAFSDFLGDERVVRAGRWKLVSRAGAPSLFDLQSDPHELHALEPSAHPIALRYCRILLGQFLGSPDRRDWFSADPKGRSVALKSETVAIDPAAAAGGD